ncbi:universal stress protein [Rhodococcoides trifolii]|uniref:Universal stress protein n=1 Tax=Rhodococcoides trifolii TaxID=908250 RepID=A0A917CKF7_9NOCA|nr:universal stress protein [Rhodococcus trifolii]GGF91601.1 universal stress protein [Rhodococcus trifolii]
MTVGSTNALVGWLPDESGRDALALGVRLALTARAANDATVTVQSCTVLPRTWPFPSMAKVDAEYKGWLQEQGKASVENAEAAMSAALQPGEIGNPAAFFAEDTAESAALTDAASRLRSDLIVLGSTAGPDGRFVAGSTTETLLHSSRVPLALAPRGTRDNAAPFTRITCAYTGTSESNDALESAAALADTWNVELHLVAFAPRRATTYPPFGGYGAEDEVTAQWSRQAEALLEQAREDVAGRHPSLSPTFAVGAGSDWEQVMNSISLTGGDLLVVGSSRLGPLARVFLGSTASKIVRHSPVPLLIVPRGSRLAR